MKPITDKAEVSIDFPDKAYIGGFTRNSEFAVSVDAEGILIKLVHPGEDRRSAEIHLHYYLLADIVAEAAKAIAQRDEAIDEDHRDRLLEAAKKFAASLAMRRPRRERK